MIKMGYLCFTKKHLNGMSNKRGLLKSYFMLSFIKNSLTIYRQRNRAFYQPKPYTIEV